MGQFLKKYGESIYATRGGPFVAPDEDKRPANAHGFALAEGRWWGGSTHKGRTVYLHILRWPADTVTLPSMEQKVVKHSVLTGGKATVKQTASGIEVAVPAGNRHAIDTIVKLEFNAPVKSA
jgi:alpha-L-fucosidase